MIGRSTGGLITRPARRFPSRVSALVLLEPALFALDEQAARWAAALRRAVPAADPADASRTVITEALGPGTWESFPGEPRELFAGMGPGGAGRDRGERARPLTESVLSL